MLRGFFILSKKCKKGIFDFMAEQQEMTQSGSPELSAIHQVFALRRGGHHAVIGWLQGCYESTGYPTAHVNSVYEAHIEEDGSQPRVLRGSDVLNDAKNTKGEVLFVNYEDLAYSRRLEAPAYTDLQETATGVPTRDIVVVRDFYNLMASRLTIQQALEKESNTRLKALDPAETTAVWAESAGHLDAGPQDTGGQPLGVNYNRWFTEQGYRDEIAKRLGVVNSDAGKNNVRSFGGGSSFDGRQHDGNAAAMNVLQRWTDLDKEIVPPFRSIIEAADDLVHELNERHFGIRVDAVLGSLAARYA